MVENHAQVAVRGKSFNVPAVEIEGRTVVVTGRFPRMATIRDEEFVAGPVFQDARAFVESLRRSRLGADILTFAEKVYQSAPRYDYLLESDNAAVAHTSNFNEWWDLLPQETRKNVRRSAKRGLVVRTAVFDEQFARGIKGIYDEMPVRQGRHFWHFGKDLGTVAAENATYAERSEFIGAYDGDELVGFLKFVYVDRVAVMMQILSKASHFDKRPMNALIAKAVEVCQTRGIEYLVYSKFTFGNKANSQIAEFKRRNGFVQVDFPRYYVPLTWRGRLALKIGAHRGLLGVLPSGLIDVLLRVRATVLRMTTKTTSPRERSGTVDSAV